MPGENEQIRYSYTGDVVSLKKATKDALSLLDQYQAEISRLTDLDAFGKNARVSKSFQSALSSTTKVVGQLENKLKSISDIKTPSFSTPLQGVSTGFSDISKVFNTLRSSTNLTTREVKNLTMQLKGAQTNLKSNSTDVETLVAKELKFQNTLSALRSKSENFRNSLDAMKNSISNVFNPLLTKLNSLQNPFSKIVSTVQTFKSKTTESFGRIRQMAEAVTSAFRRVKQSEEDAANSATKNSSKHKTLSDDLSELSDEVKEETDDLKKEEDTLKTKDKQVKKSSSSHKSFGQHLKNVSDIIKTEISKLKDLIGNFRNLHVDVSSVSKAFSALKGLFTSSIFADITNESIKYIENLNLFNVAMGESVDRGKEYVAQMQELYGMDPSNLMRYAGNFYQLADAISMPDEASANLSLGLTKATNDIASLFNVDVETVFENLSSGMQGMSRAVRKYGMDIRSVTLEQTALSLGIQSPIDSMSEANRQGLRFITMMKQASNASGDFAKTIESPANQLRIFKEQISQLYRAIGNLFIDRIKVAMQYINGFVMAIRVAITFLGTLTGAADDAFESGNSAGDVADDVASIGGAADTAAKKLQKLLAPFDELNVLQRSNDSDPTGIGSGTDILDPAIQDAIANMSWGLEDVKMKANEIRDTILALLGFKVENGVITSWASDIFLEGIEKLSQKASTYAKKFAKAVNKIINKIPISTIGKTFGKVLGSAISASATFLETIDFKSVGTTIATFVTESIGEINFYDLGKLSVSKFSITTKILTGIVTKFNQETENYKSGWAEIGSHLAEWLSGAINSIDWDVLGQTINDLVLGLLELITTTIAETDWDEVGSHIADFINNLDLSKLFKTLINTVTLLLKGLGQAFKSLWENADTETKTAIAAAGLTFLLKTVKKVIKAVDSLTGSYNSKNESLQKQTSLETSAARVLNTSLSPALVTAGSAALVTAGSFKGLNTNIGNLNAETVKTFGTVSNESLKSLEKQIAECDKKLTTLNSSVYSLDSSTVNDYSKEVTKAFKKISTETAKSTKNVNNTIAAARRLNSEPVKTYCNEVSGYFGSMKTSIEETTKAVDKLTGKLSNDDFSEYANDFSSSADISKWILPFPGGSFSLFPAPAMASGGVVKSPTYALIGEGKYDEAVIPLGNSPQMQDLVGQIAKAVKGNNNSETAPFQVYMDGDLFFETMARKNRAATIRTGVNPMLGG